MRSLILAGFIAINACAVTGVTLGAVLLLIGACTTAQVATVQTDIAAAKPVVNAAACDAQAAANIATDALAATRNPGDAANAAAASKLLGLVCFTTAAS